MNQNNDNKGRFAGNYFAYNYMKTSKGFTIIEMLVVVAIIAVLAAIVLVNVTAYINEGKNAAIKGNLATVLTNGAVYYDQTSSYSGFCSNGYVTGPSAAIDSAYGGSGNVTCAVKSSDSTAWCACSPLKVTSSDPTGSTFCVDSTGYKKETATACSSRCGTTSGACSD